MTRVIGKNKSTYILYNADEPEKQYIDKYHYRTVRKFYYIRHLADTLEGAQKRLKPNHEVRLDLSKKSDFTEVSEVMTEIPEDVFVVGKYKYMNILDCYDEKYLRRYYRKTKSKYVLQVLMELYGVEKGELK